MASGTNGIFNSDYMPYMIAASLEMSDEPFIGYVIAF